MTTSISEAICPVNLSETRQELPQPGEPAQGSIRQPLWVFQRRRVCSMSLIHRCSARECHAPRLSVGDTGNPPGPGRGLPVRSFRMPPPARNAGGLVSGKRHTRLFFFFTDPRPLPEDFFPCLQLQQACAASYIEQQAACHANPGTCESLCTAACSSRLSCHPLCIQPRRPTRSRPVQLRHPRSRCAGRSTSGGTPTLVHPRDAAQV